MASQYVALLCGINVGGKNLVKMADLRAAFESMGFADVATYIASVFVRKPLTVKKAFGEVEIREGVPEYKNTTIRSWSTTTKLLALMEPRVERPV